MTYLIVRFSTLGSVAMLVPVLSSVAANQPNDKFIVVSQKPLQAMFSHLPNVIFEEVSADISSSSLICAIQLWRQLKKRYDIDAVIDLQDSNLSRLMSFLWRLAGKRVSTIRKQRGMRKALIRNGFMKSEPLLTEFQLYSNAFLRAGLKVDDGFTSIPANDNDNAIIAERFGQKTADSCWIGFAPFATYRTNMLPYKLVKALLTYLSARRNTHVFLFGAGDIECEMLQQWESVFPNTTSVGGKLPLSVELALMRQLDLMVCMDSANQHLSSLVALPALSIWCGTHTYAGFYGWKQNPDFIIQNSTSCRPCTLHGANMCRQKNFECQNFEETTIINKLEQCLLQVV